MGKKSKAPFKKLPTDIDPTSCKSPSLVAAKVYELFRSAVERAETEKDPVLAALARKEAASLLPELRFWLAEAREVDTAGGGIQVTVYGLDVPAVTVTEGKKPTEPKEGGA